MNPTTAARNRRNLAIFGRFAVVGASGVLVNLVVLVLVERLGPDAQRVFWDLPATRFNVRWYHVFSSVAFSVAVLWNFQLNRSWAFNSVGRATWWTEFRPFFAVGVLGHLVGLGLLTLLMHDHSPVALSTTLFDDSSLLRTRLYWAQLAVIAAVTPLSFVLHKLWTFSSVRSHRLQVGEGDLLPPT